jgi:spore germination protein YaaH
MNGALRFSACLAPWDPSGLASFEAHAPQISRVYPFWYAISAAGMPLRRKDSPAAYRQRITQVAKSAGTELWPLISSFDPQSGSYDPALMRLVMGEHATRKAHIVRLIQFAKEDGAQGLDLDYEDLYEVDRPLFCGFVEEICKAAHAAGLKVGVALAVSAGLKDAARLGAACDSVQVLCTDHYSVVGRPGPLCPPDWAQTVLKDALAKVDREKLELGLPGQGLCWPPNGPALALGHAAWEQLRQAHAPERRDPATAELSLRFDGFEAWFNDSISLTAKLYPCRDLGIEQASLWPLGGEDPRLWALLETLPAPFLRKAA